MHAVSAEFINIYGSGLAMDRHIVFPEREDREHPLVGDEPGAGHLSGGIVYGGQKARLVCCSSTFKPVLIGAVKLNQFSIAVLALSPGAVLAAGSLLPRLPEPLGNHNVPDGLGVAVDAVLRF